MADISHADMIESLGINTAGFTKNLANGVANFTCELYLDYPWYMQGRIIFGTFAKGFWDEMCAKRPLGLPAPPPPPQFLGGQCPVVYEIQATITQYGNTNSSVNLGRFFGAIGGFRVAESDYRPDIFLGLQVLCFGPYNGRDSQPFSSQQWVQCTLFAKNGNASYSINYVRRVDGQPDNCGDLPSDYPHTSPPPERLSTNINVQLSTGDSYNVPISLNTTNNNNKYNLEVNAGDISLVFDFSGVSFSSNLIYNQTNKNYDQSLELGNQVTNLAQNFNTFASNSSNLSASWNLGSFTATSKGGSSVEEDKHKQSDLTYVTLNLTQVPINAKTQEGEAAQDVLYAGWFQFVAEGYYYPREPVHFRKSVFRAPKGATSYSYTLYKGFQANVTEYRT